MWFNCAITKRGLSVGESFSMQLNSQVIALMFNHKWDTIIVDRACMIQLQIYCKLNIWYNMYNVTSYGYDVFLKCMVLI